MKYFFIHIILTSYSFSSQNAELLKTLQQALVVLPFSKKVNLYQKTIKKITQSKSTFFDTKKNSIVYLHGCAGIGPPEKFDMKFLASLGYLVLAPNSFARKNKQISCDAKNKVGGLHRGVLKLRLDEAKQAIDFLKKQSFIKNDIILAGFSEGAITTAKYKFENISKKLILGWGCHAGWPEYIGLEGKQDLKILSIVADKDPWFQTSYLSGSCNAFMYNRPNARAMVLINNKHHITSLKLARSQIKKFLLIQKTN
ncbi:MAG: hypothetical protein COB02_05390 [Candidatus Cloacimonadota bacterium]|nr:MAG: hypothetical protein COB02_05390 [Candidatus Cloacimonadota bacterium]